MERALRRLFLFAFFTPSVGQCPFSFPRQEIEVAHTLPELPYAYDALEPHIDAKTM